MSPEPDGPWPVFIISLIDAGARRAPLLRQCAAIGLQVEVVTAIDGREGLPPRYEPMVDRAAAAERIGRSMSDAEIACALSHRLVYLRIVEAGLPGAIVFEDDAILTPLLAPFLAQGGDRVADVVQMDHMDARVWHRQGRPWSPQITLFPVAGNASLATGYALSTRAARHLLAQTDPLAGLADWPCDMSVLGTVVTWPRLVDHPPVAESGSAIEAGRRTLVDQTPPPRERWTRYVTATYWRRWWLKRNSRKIS